MNPQTAHRRVRQLLVVLVVAAAVVALLVLVLPRAEASGSEASRGQASRGEAHDSFHARLRVPPHGRCTITKSDAAPRARLSCRDGWTRRLAPCRQRESRRCFLHGASRGDGQGRSFAAVAGGRHYFVG